jgi:hypothetical protein
MRHPLLLGPTALRAFDTRACKDIADSGIVIGDTLLLQYLREMPKVCPCIGFACFEVNNFFADNVWNFVCGDTSFVAVDKGGLAYLAIGGFEVLYAASAKAQLFRDFPDGEKAVASPSDVVGAVKLFLAGRRHGTSCTNHRRGEKNLKFLR